MNGGPGANTLNGLAGNDWLDGNGGADLLDGGADNDVLYSTAGEGPDTLIGGTGVDLAYIFREGLTDDLVLDLSTTSLGLSDGTSASGIESFWFGAGSGDDEIRASNHPGSSSLVNYVDGASGDDLLIAGSWGAELFGAGGADTLIGGRGDDDLNGGQGRDVIKAGAGDDWMVGDTSGDFKDKLVGGRGDDTLWGSGGGDKLAGGDGADILNGEYGADRLTGGAGFDTFRFLGGGAGNDTVADYADGDVLDFLGSTLGGPQSFDTLAEFRDAVEANGFYGQIQGDDVRVDFGADGVLTLLGVSEDW
jgi:Ca2+-binding RTX toxin-like protein